MSEWSDPRQQKSISEKRYSTTKGPTEILSEEKKYFSKKPKIIKIILFILSVTFLWWSSSNLLSIIIFSIWTYYFVFIRSKEYDKALESIKQLREEQTNMVEKITGHMDSLQEYEIIKKEKIAVEAQLQNKMSQSIHLANVISGINHEVSPWLGGTKNMLLRLKNKAKNLDRDDIEKVNNFLDMTEQKYKQAIEANGRAVDILKVMSRNVKKVQQYSVSECDVFETLDSWARVALMDIFVKDYISEDNITIDKESLDFEAEHSPMLLAQIILNLCKNSIEHNIEMVEDLEIYIVGDATEKKIYYRDNGKGIDESELGSIFSPGITSKDDDNKELHGFGLSACLQYCITMKANIFAEKSDSGALFIIELDKDGDWKEYTPVSIAVDSPFPDMPPATTAPIIITERKKKAHG